MHVLTIPAPADPAPDGKRPAHQQVYERLRASILFGDLVPGQPVTLQGLTESLGAGMTPVREAVRRLISDGALSMRGNRRVIVPELTSACVEELEFLRETLEPELAFRAAGRVGADDIAALAAEDAALNTAIAHGDVSGYLSHNYRFHSLLHGLAAAPILAATADRLWLRFGPSLRVVCGRQGTLNLPDRHEDLIAALRANDAPAAADALRADVRQGMEQVRSALRDAAERP